MASTHGKCQFSEIRYKQMTQDHAVNFKSEVKCWPVCLWIPCCYNFGLLLSVFKMQRILSCSGIQQGAAVFCFFNASWVSTFLFVQRKLIFFPLVRYLLKVTYRCQLKKHTWPKSWELGLIGILRTSSLEDSISGDPRELFPRRLEKESGYIEVIQQGTGNLNIKRLLLIKETQVPCVQGFSTFPCMGRYKHPGLLKLVFMCISSILGQVLPFDCSCPSFSVTLRGGGCGRWLPLIPSCIPPTSPQHTPIPQCLPGKWLVAAK